MSASRRPPDPWSLLDQAADDLLAADALAELWERRATYWRAVAGELAAGDREPYPGRDGRVALGEAAPAWARWVPPPEPPSPLNRSMLLRWWLRGEHPLGQPERADRPGRPDRLSDAW